MKERKEDKDIKSIIEETEKRKRQRKVNRFHAEVNGELPRD